MNGHISHFINIPEHLEQQPVSRNQWAHVRESGRGDVPLHAHRVTNGPLKDNGRRVEPSHDPFTHALLFIFILSCNSYINRIVVSAGNDVLVLV